MKHFRLSFTCGVTLTAAEIWPDGAPENPTVEDVWRAVRACGGARDVLRDWNLDDEFELDVTDGGDS